MNYCIALYCIVLYSIALYGNVRYCTFSDHKNHRDHNNHKEINLTKYAPIYYDSAEQPLSITLFIEHFQVIWWRNEEAWAQKF